MRENSNRTFKTLGWGIVGIVQSIVANVASGAAIFLGYKEFALTLISVSLCAMVILVAITTWSWYRASGPLAVEVFLLDDKDRLLLYRHPYHQVLLPPGGKVGIVEDPLAAVERTLSDRVGLDADSYDLLSLHPSSSRQKFPSISLLPCPFRIQFENHPQRRLRSRHLDLLFFGVIKPHARVREAREYGPAQFWTREEMAGMIGGHSQELFPDVLDAYDVIIDARAATAK